MSNQTRVRQQQRFQAGLLVVSSSPFGRSSSEPDEVSGLYRRRLVGLLPLLYMALRGPSLGSIMQMEAAPAAAVAASAAARVACDTAATICTSEAPCGRAAWDCSSHAIAYQNACLQQWSKSRGDMASNCSSKANAAPSALWLTL